MMTYYLIEHQYVGPNGDDHLNDGRYLDIQTRPGCTNSSFETREEGWLGTTNDWASYARGTIEADSLDDAIAQARELHDLGDWTDSEMQSGVAFDYSDAGLVSLPYAETRFSFIPAGDWLHDSRNDLGVTANSTDEELIDLAHRVDEQAADSLDDLPVGLVGTLEFLQSLRDELASPEDLDPYADEDTLEMFEDIRDSFD